jgi:hypothetical protein
MKAPAAVAVALITCGCSPVFEIGVGVAPSKGFPGGGPVFVGRVQQDIGKHGYCEYEHVSRIGEGRPFNDDREGVLDVVACGVRLKAGD